VSPQHTPRHTRAVTQKPLTHAGTALHSKSHTKEQQGTCSLQWMRLRCIWPFPGTYTGKVDADPGAQILS